MIRFALHCRKLVGRGSSTDKSRRAPTADQSTSAVALVVVMVLTKQLLPSS
jgi:hypothetical protein